MKGYRIPLLQHFGGWSLKLSPVGHIELYNFPISQPHVYSRSKRPFKTIGVAYFVALDNLKAYVSTQYLYELMNNNPSRLKSEVGIPKRPEA